MNRLTFETPDGSRGVVGMNRGNECEKLIECVSKLRDYERTGLAPEQIREIDKLYAEKCREVSELKTELSRLKNEMSYMDSPLAMGDRCEMGG